MDNRPRIVIIINSLAFGGAERVVALLINQLESKFAIHLVLFNNIISYPIPEQVKILQLNETPGTGNVKALLKLPIYAKRVSAYCKENNIQVCISFLNRPCYVNALMKKIFGYKGKSIMCERSHQSSILNFTGGGSSMYKILTKNLIRFAYNAADEVVANSKLSAEDLQKNFGVKKQVQVIYNPINISQVRGMMEEAIPETLNEKNFYFVATGNFRIEKNFQLLLEAMAGLKHLPIKLLLVGGGRLETELVALTKQLDITGSVIFTGFQNNPYKYMRKGHCFVLSSFTEGFPNVLLEALACNKPVISTDCKSGPREILAPGTSLDAKDLTDIEISEFGILIPNNNVESLRKAMITIYSEAALKADYEQRSLSRATTFDVEVIVPKFQQVFSL